MAVMAQSLLTVLETMREKIDALNASIEQLHLRNRALEEENKELRREIEAAVREKEKAQLETEYLAVSHRLAADPDTIVDARRLIAGWIRNIDRCIEMLKE